MIAGMIAPTTNRAPAAPTAPPPLSSPRLLLVDGDAASLRQIEAALRGGGFRPRSARTAQGTLEMVLQGAVDAVIIDPLTAGLDGAVFCQSIRARSTVPIIVLSRLTAERDRVRALDAGADDILTKPVGPAELLARLRAILRRANTAAPLDALDLGALTIRLAERQVFLDGREVRLTPTEFSLLVLLTRHAGTTLSHTFLLQRIWGPEYRDEHEYLWAYVRRLRQKLEADPKQPRYILSEPGVGYRLASAAELEEADHPVDVT